MENVQQLERDNIILLGLVIELYYLLRGAIWYVDNDETLKRIEKYLKERVDNE
jgi:hypothetical protein